MQGTADDITPTTKYASWCHVGEDETKHVIVECEKCDLTTQSMRVSFREVV